MMSENIFFSFGRAMAPDSVLDEDGLVDVPATLSMSALFTRTTFRLNNGLAGV
jgi:hypothetical protein